MSRVRALQHAVKVRIREIENDNWSTLMEEITPSHKTYWAVAKALKSDVCVTMPALEIPDNSLTFYDQKKAEYIADIMKLQYSLNSPPPLHLEQVNRVENEILHRSLLPHKEDLPSVSVADEVQKLIQGLNVERHRAWT
ncbi:hypothetical protein EVAR_22850_1 [Eumeta japonica]|uniref:Uncharacterized protein n=1 Tax=Eumeta variegata TaxID=151549 RepID=A0A4C1VE31_EUMVA|nr:hypothetical protein EVAR_22850_1 [Eumeta japonica]